MALSAIVPIIEESGKKPPAAVTSTFSARDSLVLTLIIEDPEVLSELKKHRDDTKRSAFAKSALRIGILALRQAEGAMDTEALRNEGQRLINDLSHELQVRVEDIDQRIATSLKLYFDPTTGHFTERVERLIKKDGDLERVLRQQVGDGENSELARALAHRIGENSPLMRRLNPQDAGGITSSIEQSVKTVLDGEQKRLLKEFSLDNEAGALTRVVSQIEQANNLLKGDIEKQIKGAVREFSLDDETSALSRLVRKVEDARDKITDEFSADNANSAINKLNLVLADTRRSVNDNLTLDNEHSALARLQKQLSGVLEEIRVKNETFQQDVSAKLASLLTKHQEEHRSTTHGVSFEEDFCAFVQRDAQKTGDIFTATGATPGLIPRCKKGDAVLELGSEAAAAGQKIVFEAKGNKSYKLDDARLELEEARRNRGASVGVFVFARGSAPEGLQPFSRIESDLFVTWDSSDVSTDIYLSAAINVAKALSFRQSAAASKANGDIAGMERAVNLVEKQLKTLDDMQTWTSTIQTNSGKVLREIGKIRDTAAEQIQQLRNCLDALKATE